MLDPLVDKMTKHKWISKVNYSDLTITLRNKSLIQLRSSENFNALRGVGLDFICIDEFSDVDERAWFEVLRPTLSDKSKEGSALFLGTPRGYGNWSYNLFTKQETDNNWKSFKYTTLDGGQVSANEIEQAKQDLDERTFKQEYLSDFVNYSGAIYYNFNREENVLKEYIPSSNTIHIGVDFNLDPMSAVVSEVKQDYLYVYDEIVIYGSNTDELVEEINYRYSGKHIFVYPDPASKQRKTSAGGRTDLSILKTQGTM